ncbi:Mth938-like domain-containing protein [Pseudooceanicola aestuarii]|uniref:Mth938-like domain-containing protein n=1 Tax=Pseudooceanicola aestuarii TaxID=2697319 RepID=UPI0013D2BBB6|nr:Mth938-like domain-containing protein [Pseudooceanicola aestuarii]
MQMYEIDYANARPIDGYGPGFFRVGGKVIHGPVLVTADRATSWAGPQDPAPLLALAGQVDVLFYGTGAEMTHVPKALQDQLEAAGIACDPMASATACRTYNVLLSEGRRVAAALNPV